jgi:hypothetical protein
MDVNNINDNLFCKSCNYKTTKPSDWLKHIETEKHKRNGQKKLYICPTCNEQFFNSYVLKIHNIMIHAPLEEKLKQKYYCQSCDVVFISELYYIKHNNGKKHFNRIKVIESLKNLNK